jgi:hypothetical protein
VRASAPAATARRVASGVPSLGRLRRDLDPDVVEALDRALRRRPEERGGVSDLRDALHAAAPEADAGEGRTLVLPEPAIEEPWRARSPPRTRRRSTPPSQRLR